MEIVEPCTSNWLTQCKLFLAGTAVPFSFGVRTYCALAKEEMIIFNVRPCLISRRRFFFVSSFVMSLNTSFKRPINLIVQQGGKINSNKRKSIVEHFRSRFVKLRRLRRRRRRSYGRFPGAPSWRTLLRPRAPRHTRLPPPAPRRRRP